MARKAGLARASSFSCQAAVSLAKTRMSTSGWILTQATEAFLTEMTSRRVTPRSNVGDVAMSIDDAIFQKWRVLNFKNCPLVTHDGGFKLVSHKFKVQYGTAFGVRASSAEQGLEQ